jgi:hypothetical protein
MMMSCYYTGLDLYDLGEHGDVTRQVVVSVDLWARAREFCVAAAG